MPTQKDDVIHAVPEEDVPVGAVDTEAAPDASYTGENRDQYFAQQRDTRQVYYSNIASLITAAKEKAVLTGKIIRVENDAENAYWCVLFNDAFVRIPFEETFAELPQDLLNRETPNLVQRRARFLRKSLSLSIPFTIQQFSSLADGTTMVIGSRKAALPRVQSRYFGPNAVHHPAVGDIVAATVLSVGFHSAWFNICGVDVRIPIHELTHRYIDNMEQIYAIGESVQMQILDVTENPNIIRASQKPLEMERARTLTGKIAQGAYCVGTVTTIRLITTDEGVSRYRASLWLDEGIPAYASTPIMVTVNGVDAKGYLHCRPIRKIRTVV